MVMSVEFTCNDLAVNDVSTDKQSDKSNHNGNV